MFHTFIFVLFLQYTLIADQYFIACLYLYTFNTVMLFFVILESVVVNFGNIILNILNGIQLPLLLMSILYVILVIFCACA